MAFLVEFLEGWVDVGAVGARHVLGDAPALHAFLAEVDVVQVVHDAGLGGFYPPGPHLVLGAVHYLDLIGFLPAAGLFHGLQALGAVTAGVFQDGLGVVPVEFLHVRVGLGPVEEGQEGGYLGGDHEPVRVQGVAQPASVGHDPGVLEVLPGALGEGHAHIGAWVLAWGMDPVGGGVVIGLEHAHVRILGQLLVSVHREAGQRGQHSRGGLGLDGGLRVPHIGPEEPLGQARIGLIEQDVRVGRLHPSNQA